MKIRFEAEVGGKIAFSKKRVFEINGFIASLVFKDGRLQKIALIRRLDDSELEDLTNEVQHSSDAQKQTTFHLDLPGEMYDEAEETFQIFESFAGLKGVKRVAWDNIEVEFIPESDEEEDEIEALSLQVSETFPDRLRHWDFDFEDTNWEIVSDLKVPLAFFRRARQYHREKEYINAYINLYFIIEGLFSGGHHSNVERELLDSDELLQAVDTLLPEILDDSGGELEPFFDFYSKEPTVEGFIRLIVTIRHQLSHFFIDHDRPHSPNPFNQDEYLPLSTALMSICVYILEIRVNEIREY